MTASVGAQSQTLDNLINTSGSIKNTFDRGIKIIGGMTQYAPIGGIAPVGSVQTAYVTYEQADAYNAAVTDVQNTTYGMTAQEYIDGQAENASVDFGNAVDAYVNAARVMIEVVRVNEMAVEAEASGDVTQVQAVQNYIATNDVTLETEEIDAYNDSMDGVEFAAQSYAAFTSIAGNGEQVAALQADADELSQDFSNAGDASFDAQTQMVSIGFIQGNNTDSAILVDVSGAFKTVEDLLAAGEQSNFYNTGPTANECFFSGPSTIPDDPCYDPNYTG